MFPIPEKDLPVVGLIAQGMSNKKVAETLGKERSAVDFYIRRLGESIVSGRELIVAGAYMTGQLIPGEHPPLPPEALQLAAQL